MIWLYANSSSKAVSNRQGILMRQSMSKMTENYGDGTIVYENCPISVELQGCFMGAVDYKSALLRW